MLLNKPKISIVFFIYFQGPTIFPGATTNLNPLQIEIHVRKHCNYIIRFTVGISGPWRERYIFFYQWYYPPTRSPLEVFTDRIIYVYRIIQRIRYIAARGVHGYRFTAHNIFTALIQPFWPSLPRLRRRSNGSGRKTYSSEALTLLGDFSTTTTAAAAAAASPTPPLPPTTATASAGP